MRPLEDIKDRNEIYNRFNMELNKEFANKNGIKNLYFTGDYLNNKSRVTGAMMVGMKLGEQIVKEHFY